eukprot:509655-Pyramimonas_sp.AAC.1
MHERIGYNSRPRISGQTLRRQPPYAMRSQGSPWAALDKLYSKSLRIERCPRNIGQFRRRRQSH